MTRALRGLAALTLLAVAPLSAQGPIADRLLQLQGKEAPEASSPCKLTGGGPNVTGASTRFQNALTNAIVPNKRRLLTEGRDLTIQAITTGGQGTSSKAWYFLARIYLQQGDLAGADSAFTHLVQVAPTCAAEASLYRVRGWSMLVSAAAALRTAGAGDSAVFLARAATVIDPTRPQSWYMIGTAFLDQQQYDSASFYLEKSLNSPADSSSNAASIREAAAYQAGVVAYNRHDYPSAVRFFAEAVRLKSDDADARRNLAASLRQAGMADSATKVEGAMMTAVAGSDSGLSVTQLFDNGVRQYNAHEYAAAALAFEKIIVAEPYNRDALFNLAQAYSGANNFDKLLETSLRLRAMDPLSFAAIQLVGAAYRGKHNQPKMLEAATALGGATVDVQVTGFSVSATGVTMTMHVVGRDGRDINDRAVPAVPIPVVVEFLNKDTVVVSSVEATIPAPGAVVVGTPAASVRTILGAPTSVNTTRTAAGASEQWVYGNGNFVYLSAGRVTGTQASTQTARSTDPMVGSADVTVVGTGAGIMAWRYHRK